MDPHSKPQTFAPRLLREESMRPRKTAVRFLSDRGRDLRSGFRKRANLSKDRVWGLELVGCGGLGIKTTDFGSIM